LSPTELHALVDRVTAALGPDASAAEVENVVRAVADRRRPRNVEAPPRGATVGEGPITGRIIVTAYGCDRPGILAAISSELRDLGVNVLDVSQKILQGYFTLILLADITGSGATIRRVQERLAHHGEQLGVRVLVQHEELFEAMARP
jgi:ACT domain-containing protein